MVLESQGVEKYILIYPPPPPMANKVIGELSYSNLILIVKKVLTLLASTTQQRTNKVSKKQTYKTLETSIFSVQCPLNLCLYKWEWEIEREE